MSIRFAQLPAVFVFGSGEPVKQRPAPGARIGSRSGYGPSGAYGRHNGSPITTSLHLSSCDAM